LSNTRSIYGKNTLQPKNSPQILQVLARGRIIASSYSYSFEALLRAATPTLDSLQSNTCTNFHLAAWSTTIVHTTMGYTQAQNKDIWASPATGNASVTEIVMTVIWMTTTWFPISNGHQVHQCPTNTPHRSPLEHAWSHIGKMGLVSKLLLSA
jgi:hypothetical protein